MHSPDCAYDAVVEEPAYPFCSGPIIWVDTTHENWHQITPEAAEQPGRFLGFAELMFADGYDVRDSDESLTDLEVGGGPDILVIASAFVQGDEPDALTPAETAAVVAWVEGGGSLLLVFDHPPFDRVGELLHALGLKQVPVGSDTMQTIVFRRLDGTLNGDSYLSEGVARVAAFRGSTLARDPEPPPGVSAEPILRFAPDAVAEVDGESVDIGGRLSGATVTLGRGRVYVSAEAAGLTTQTNPSGTTVGMHVTPFNERFVLNVIHWLDRLD